MISNEELFEMLKGYLNEMFEIPRDKISIGSDLAADLGLDSIDAVDLMLKLQDYTGKKISAEDFRSVRSVGDVVAKVHEHIAARN
jgi:acyl carrier protein